MTVFLTGCVTAEGRLNRAGAVKGEAGIVSSAIEELKSLPDLPADCSRREVSGVRKGDRLDVALVKTDRALGRANARVGRCAAWYGDLKAGFSDAPG